MSCLFLRQTGEGSTKDPVKHDTNDRCNLDTKIDIYACRLGSENRAASFEKTVDRRPRDK